MMDSFVADNERIPVLNGMRYFYSKTDECNFFPRLEITMADPVVLPHLQAAAEAAMARYRVFRLVVVQDDGEFYLTDNPRKPKVHVCDGTRHTTGTDDNNGHLTWIGASGHRIIIEFFHGISDIHGALPFVRALLQVYCHRCYGEGEAFLPPVSLQEEMAECTDSLCGIDTAPSPATGKQAQSPAFQFPDQQMAPGCECYAYSLKADAAQFDAFMRNNASSRTAVFALLMNLAIASCASLDQAPVITSVAADVRKIYGAEDTLRDCTDTIPLVFDADIQALPMQRQLALYRQMIVDAMQPEVRLAVAAEIKKNNQLMEKRNPSLAGKRQFCKWVHQYSYSNYTYSISNIGLVSLGEGIESHVLGVDSIMCANTYPVMIEILQYKQQYHICYCTRLHHDPYVQKFYELLTSAGISCTCEQRENYVEALAVF